MQFLFFFPFFIFDFFHLNLFILFHSCYFFFSNSFLLFFLFPLACIISSYLSDVITDCLQVQNLFDQTNKTSATDFSRIFILEWTEPAVLLPLGNRFAFASLPKGLIFSVDISSVEIYSFSMKDSLLSEISIVHEKFEFKSFFFQTFFACVFFFVRPIAAYENNI